MTANHRYVVQDITTGLAWKGRPVGITRYEQELAKGLLRWDTSGTQLRFVRFDSDTLRYVWVKANEVQNWLKRLDAPAHKQAQEISLTRLQSMQGPSLGQKSWKLLRRSVYRMGSLISQPVAEYAERILCLILDIARAFKDYFAARRRYHLREQVSLIQDQMAAEVVHQDFVDFREVSCYISCGLDWDDKDTATIYREKKKHGFKCIFTIYDLVPQKFPEFLPRDPGRYLRYFADALWTADRILTISESSKRDILDFATTNYLPMPPIDIVSPGSDLDMQHLTVDQAHTSPLVQQTLAQAGRYALTVGTIEARKNHRLLAEIWLQMIQELGLAKTPHLVIVGGRGWGVGDLFRTLESWPDLMSRVHILEGLNDQELAQLYENCSLFLYPSFYEGWGIPLTEAAAFGKPMISSSTSSMPEAAPPGLSMLLDPLDYPAWYAAIKDWATGKTGVSAAAQGGATPIRTWKNAGEEFVRKVESFLKTVANASPV